MSIPDCDWYKVLSTILITENGITYLFGWFEKAKNDVSDISPLFVEAPSHCLNDQVSKSNMWCIWVPALKILVILF